MGERVEVSVPVLLDAAGRTAIAAELASADMAALRRGLVDARAGWPGATATAYSNLLAAWESAEVAILNKAEKLSEKLQVGAAEYAETERRSAQTISAMASPTELKWFP